MRLSHCVATFILACELLSVSLYGQAVSVRLDTPNYPVLRDEVFPISVTVSNGCQNGFYVIRDPLVAMNRQLFFIPMDVDGNHLFDNTYRNPVMSIGRELFSSLVAERTASVLLQPGSTFQWDYTGKLPIHFGATNLHLAVQLLTGIDSWHYSNTNVFSYIDESMDLGGNVFCGGYLYHDAIMTFDVRKIPITGNEFLFLDSGDRLCEVPHNSILGSNMHTNSGVLTVSFGTNAPPVRYHVPTCKVLPPDQ